VRDHLTRAGLFAREQARVPFQIILSALVPFVFVIMATDILQQFSRALGGGLASGAAGGLGAGWSAGFVSGVLGFFTAHAARGADRRLAMAGPGGIAVAISRLLAGIVLAVATAFAAFAALAIVADIAHPWHAFAAILGFGVIYLGIGVIAGTLIGDPLAGSLLVVLVFLLDAFAGPGMAADPSDVGVSRPAGEILIAAGSGRASAALTWLEALGYAVTALVLATGAFAWTARRRA